jgi:hypothetical protein
MHAPHSLALVLVLSACARPTQPAPSRPDDGDAPGESGGCAASGKEWFTPAGSGEPTISPGCFARCEATACGSGYVCSTVMTNPCGETEDGQMRTCMAVAQTTRLCLPAQ